jgi:hypothetical protein
MKREKIMEQTRKEITQIILQEHISFASAEMSYYNSVVLKETIVALLELLDICTQLENGAPVRIINAMDTLLRAYLMLGRFEEADAEEGEPSIPFAGQMWIGMASIIRGLKQFAAAPDVNTEIQDLVKSLIRVLDEAFESNSRKHDWANIDPSDFEKLSSDVEDIMLEIQEKSCEAEICFATTVLENARFAEMHDLLHSEDGF